MAQVGIGFLGSGQAMQAIHLPALARLGRESSVRTVMDAHAPLASEVAVRCGATATRDAAKIYDDDAINVVAICSPSSFHAEQTIACCRAGKRVVLCEKPLATTSVEARAVRDAAETSGTTILVGNMHSYDPAFRRASDAWSILDRPARVVRSAIYLPSNDIFVAQAADALAAPAPSGGRRVTPAAERIEQAVLGLAVHNLPLVRQFLPHPGTLAEARFLEPYGYSLTLAGAEHAAILSALMPGDWPPQWSFVAISDECVLRAAFPPSYVLAGSARIELIRHGEVTVIEDAHNGYEALWDHIFGICDEEQAPLFGQDAVMADLDLALSLATSAAALVGQAA